MRFRPLSPSSAPSSSSSPSYFSSPTRTNATAAAAAAAAAAADETAAVAVTFKRRREPRKTRSHLQTTASCGRCPFFNDVVLAAVTPRTIAMWMMMTIMKKIALCC